MSKVADSEKAKLEKEAEQAKLEKKRPCYSQKKYEGIEFCIHRINSKFCPICKAKEETEKAEKLSKKLEKAEKKEKKLSA